MEHLNEFLNKKRINILEILKLHCEITEKIDGSAFQSFNDNNTLIFGKRGENPFKKSANELTEIDLLTNQMYYDVYTYLNNYKHILKSYKILNFEIFSNDKTLNNHIVSYENQFDNNIILLSGLSLNNEILSAEELKIIAKELKVSDVTVLWSGQLTNGMIKNIINYKDNNIFLWNYMLDITHLDPKRFVEGVVLTFKDNDNNVKRILKVQNPEFHIKIMSHLYNENKNRNEINLEKYFNFIIKNTILNYDENDSVAKRLLKLYMYIESSNNNLIDVEKTLEKIVILKNLRINTLLANKIYDLFPDNIENIKYPCLLSFILFGFMHKRKKYPLWCSKEYQDNILNPFIDKFLN